MSITSDAPGSYAQAVQRLEDWARRVGLGGKLAIALAIAAALSGLATYAAWSGSTPLEPNPQHVLILLVVDLVLLLSLGAVVARRLVRLWVERRSGSAGSRLHVRIVALFSLVAVTPAIITAVFSALFFHLGVQSWFSERVSTAVQESLAVAEAYVVEHRQALRADVLAMANDLNRAAPRLLRSPTMFSRVLQTQAALRALSEATVFDSTGRVLARTTLSLSAAFGSLPLDLLEQANQGRAFIFSADDNDQVRALVRLDRYLDAYLYVGRFVDPNVVQHVERTREVVAEYKALEGARSGIQLTSALIFIVVALLLLLAAVWLGLFFAGRLVRPVSALVSAAERVREGDLTARVPEGPVDDEIGTLSRAFNRMTDQLMGQRRELVDANRQLDRRRRFIEAVLGGVSAGVIGLDRTGRINLSNRSAAQLLDAEESTFSGEPLSTAVPEMEPLLQEARARPDRVVEGEVAITRGGRRRILIVRVGADHGQDERRGYVVTFDDVTDLVAAQRTAAWADVARRIAHEIKNPLTPIQLAAERLKRKYLPQVSDDREVFVQCTETIVRQVGDIRRMVDEFSSFARMPAPALKSNDLRQVVEQGVFAQQVAHPGITYDVALPEEPVIVRCDERQLGQVFTNVLQNAAEAIEAREAAEGRTPTAGRVMLTLERDEEAAVVRIVDNGPGLPVDDRDRLTEPYVTRRAKGTGLGLAIVKKIMDDHGGRLTLEDARDGGAMVTLRLPLAQADDDNEEQLDGVRVASHGT